MKKSKYMYLEYRNTHGNDDWPEVGDMVYATRFNAFHNIVLDIIGEVVKKQGGTEFVIDTGGGRARQINLAEMFCTGNPDEFMDVQKEMAEYVIGQREEEYDEAKKRLDEAIDVLEGYL